MLLVPNTVIQVAQCLLWSQVDEFLGTKAAWNAHAILFTAKSTTAPLTKSLASQFEGKIAFGESRASNAQLAQQYNITRYHSPSPFRSVT